MNIDTLIPVYDEKKEPTSLAGGSSFSGIALDY